MATTETATEFITKYADKDKERFFMTDTNVGTGNYSGPDRKQAVHFVAEEGNYKLAATAKVERAVARFDYKAAKNKNEYEKFHKQKTKKPRLSKIPQIKTVVHVRKTQKLKDLKKKIQN